MDSASAPLPPALPPSEPPRPGVRQASRRWSTRLLVILRRTHMYAGLFLLPWVFLYGITGAMFNHYGLFTDAQIVTAPDDLLAETVMSEFPTTDELASQVVEARSVWRDRSAAGCE